MINLATTEQIIDEIRAGRMVILVDEEDRENEGDLLIAADCITPENINFMAKYGRGLVCLTLTQERCAQLALTPMANQNNSAYGTNFTVSIEAAQGVTTGISAADRAHTIQVAIAADANPSDLVKPGHIFPIMAQKGGVLIRSGHTEAGCDLAMLAGYTPAAVICEIMNDDGSMARLPELTQFAQQHGLLIGTIADLIQYRIKTESMITRVAQRDLETPWGTFHTIAYRDSLDGYTHLALITGQPVPSQETLVRVHEPFSLLDILDSKGNQHSWHLPDALTTLAKSTPGVAVLLNCGVHSNSHELLEQFSHNPNLSTSTQKNQSKFRTYGIGAQILRDIGVGKMRLLCMPNKIPAVAGYGLEITGYKLPNDMEKR